MRHLRLTCVSYLFLMQAMVARRGKNPEWTVPQVHLAISCQLSARLLQGAVSSALLKQIATTLNYQQKRNAAARVSHTKRTIHDLQQLGIDLKTVPLCRESG